MTAFRAIVRGSTVYAGDDPVLAMRTFEQFAEGAATAEGAGMIVYVINPASLKVDALGMGSPEPQRMVGSLTGISQEQWRGRDRLP